MLSTRSMPFSGSGMDMRRHLGGSSGVGIGVPKRGSRFAAAVSPGHQLTLHAGETTISLPFTPAQAAQLDAAFKALLGTFAEKQKAERPRRWDTMEVRFGTSAAAAAASRNGTSAAAAAAGGGGEGGVGGGSVELFEAFCNPNAHSSVVDAKVLLTLRASGVSVATEARLSGVRADLDAYMAAVGGGGN